MTTVECYRVHTKFESASSDIFLKTFLMLIKIIKSVCQKNKIHDYKIDNVIKV